MKRFWFCFALLAAILGGSLFNAYYIQNFADSLTQRLQGAEDMAERGAWEQASTITQQCLDDWHRRHAYLHIISRHADTDDILISFGAVTQYLQLEEMDQYAAENQELIAQITLLAEMEQPDWLNVL